MFTALLKGQDTDNRAQHTGGNFCPTFGPQPRTELGQREELVLRATRSSMGDVTTEVLVARIFRLSAIFEAL